MTYVKETMREKHLAVKRMLFSATFRAVLSALTIVCGVLYVVENSSVSTKGYDINALQKKITELKQENQRVEFEVAQYGSMDNIQARLKNLNLVAADKSEYVTLPGTAVARR